MKFVFFQKKFYFLGICGISMSALASITNVLGGSVSGSDKHQNEQFEKLKSFANVKIGQNVKALLNCDVFVYSLAVQSNHPELKLAEKLGKKIYSRSQYLGLLASCFDNVIAITGAHGKSTVTCMLTEVFCKNDIDFCSHIGAVDGLIESNFYYGGNKYFLTEACEYKKGFLSLTTSLAVITNIDFDHPDAYKDTTELNTCFKLFAENAERIVVDEKNAPLFLDLNKETVVLNTDDILKTGKLMGNISLFNVSKPTKKVLSNIALRYFRYKKPPRHNVINAAFAYVVSLMNGLSPFSVQNALSSFNGVQRRYETIGKINDCIVIADYAHHPNQIKGVLEDTKKQFPDSFITVVFEPHTYSRTKALLDEFSVCFDLANRLFILPTYAARETEDMGASAKELFEKIVFPDKKYMDCTYEEVYQNLLRLHDKNGVILLLGAGDIYKIKNYL